MTKELPEMNEEELLAGIKILAQSAKLASSQGISQAREDHQRFSAAVASARQMNIGDKAQQVIAEQAAKPVTADEYRKQDGRGASQGR